MMEGQEAVLKQQGIDGIASNWGKAELQAVGSGRCF